ncbi:hypothetical protein QAD02_016673 [Eretmocerus hayati]|uniref:Uncharacterized protein n=1 Tax=Eretmocerus hayati TaxID=131215 RepID=A0ACC2PBR2_9HYME|nr:hypothetical protein QAD02_016673 [Eretmocerus hayati]
MEDSFDIYADLDNLDVDQVKSDSDSEERFLRKSQAYIESLRADIANLQEQIKALQKINNNVEVNFSSLLKTAKAEIIRKDKQIAELRSKNDALAFRRDKRHQNRVQNYPPAPRGNPISERNHYTGAGNQEDAHIPSLLHLPYPDQKQVHMNEDASYNNIPDDGYIAYTKNNYLQRPSSDESEDETKTDGMDFKKTVFGERLHNRLMEEREAERKTREEQASMKSTQHVVEGMKKEVKDTKPEETSSNASSDKENLAAVNKPPQLAFKVNDPRKPSDSLLKMDDHSYYKIKEEDELRTTTPEYQDEKKDIRAQINDRKNSPSGRNHTHDNNASSGPPMSCKVVKDECEDAKMHAAPSQDPKKDSHVHDDDENEYIPLPLRNLKSREQHQHADYRDQSRYNPNRFNDNYRHNRRDDSDAYRRRHDHAGSSDIHRARQDDRCNRRNSRERNGHRVNERSRSRYRTKESDKGLKERSRSRPQREEDDLRSRERGRSRHGVNENGTRDRSRSRHQRRGDVHCSRQRSRSRHEIKEIHQQPQNRNSSRHRIKETNSSEKDMDQKNHLVAEEMRKIEKSDYKQSLGTEKKSAVSFGSKDRNSSERGMRGRNQSCEEKEKRRINPEHKRDHHSKERSSSRHTSKETDSSAIEMDNNSHPMKVQFKKDVRLENQVQNSEEKTTSRHHNKEIDSSERKIDERKRPSPDEAKKLKNSEHKPDHLSERSSKRFTGKDTDFSKIETVDSAAEKDIRKNDNPEHKENDHTKEMITSRRSSKEVNQSGGEMNKICSFERETKRHKKSEHKSKHSPKKMKREKDSKGCKTSDDLHNHKEYKDKVKTPKRKRLSNSEERSHDLSKRQKISSSHQPQKNLFCDESKSGSKEINSSDLELERLRILKLLEADENEPEIQDSKSKEDITKSSSTITKNDNTISCDPANKKERTKINMTEYLERKRVTLNSTSTPSPDHSTLGQIENVCIDDAEKSIESTLSKMDAIEVSTKSLEPTQLGIDEIEDGEILDSPNPKLKNSSSHSSLPSPKVLNQDEADGKSKDKLTSQEKKQNVGKSVKKALEDNRNNENAKVITCKAQDQSKEVIDEKNYNKCDRKISEENSKNVSILRTVLESKSQDVVKGSGREDQDGNKAKRFSSDEPIQIVIESESRRRTRSGGLRGNINEAGIIPEASKRSYEMMSTRQKTQKALKCAQECKKSDPAAKTLLGSSQINDIGSMEQKVQHDQKKKNVENAVSDNHADRDHNLSPKHDALTKRTGHDRTISTEEVPHKDLPNSITSSNSNKKNVPPIVEGAQNIVYVKQRRRRSRVLGDSENKIPVNRSIKNETTSSPIHKRDGELNTSNSSSNESPQIKSPQNSIQDIEKSTKSGSKSEPEVKICANQNNEIPKQDLTGVANTVTVESKTEVMSDNISSRVDKPRESNEEALSKKLTKPVMNSQDPPKCEPVDGEAKTCPKLPPAGIVIYCKRRRRRAQLSDSR